MDICKMNHSPSLKGMPVLFFKIRTGPKSSISNKEINQCELEQWIVQSIMVGPEVQWNLSKSSSTTRPLMVNCFT